MRRLAHRLAFTALLGTLLLGTLSVVGCGNEQAPIDRVGVNVVEKSAFTGSWYMHQVIIDADYEASPITYIGSASGDGTAGWTGTAIPRVRWVIDENFLYAYRDYEIVGDTEDPYRIAGDEDEDYLGEPVAAFAIETHFDIRRTYNTVTGEEQNVIVENDTDRHWYERQFMRVDWSQNLVSPMFSSGRGFVAAESVSLYVQDASTFPDAWRPQFHFMCDGSDDANCDTGDLEHQEDYEAGQLYSFSFVNQHLLRPAAIPFFGPICRQVWGVGPNCATVSVFARTSFMRVSETREYEPINWDNDRMERAGYFRLDRLTYDRSSEAGDPSYGITDFTNQAAIRHNIWRQTFQHDADDNILRDENNRGVPLPYADREIRPIVWYGTVEVPAHIAKTSFELVSSWNETYMELVRNLQGRANPQYAAQACQMDDPASYCYCAPHPETGEILNPTCAGRYDPFESPTEAASRITSGEPFDCYISGFDEDGNPVNAMTNEPDWNSPGVSVEDFNGWFRARAVGDECVTMFQVNTCNQGNLEDWDNLECEQRGDIRYKFLSYVTQQQAGLLGVAQMRSDPVTGEVVTGDANSFGSTFGLVRTRGMEAYDLINGNITEQEFYTGEDVRAYLNALEHVEVSAPVRIDFSVANRIGSVADPNVGSGINNVMAHAMERAELLRGAEGRANTYEDRIHLLEGTSIEQQMMAELGPEAFAMADVTEIPAGMNPNQIPESMYDQFSPFRRTPIERLDEQRELALRQWMSSAIDINNYDDDSVLFFINQHRDWPRARVEFELDRINYHGTQAHEMGHCLGLRHDFGGSADSNNYRPGYYVIDDRFPLPDPEDFNNDGTPGLAPAEQIAFENAWEDTHRLRELAGIEQHMNSSIMDYAATWYEDAQGISAYDNMAISMGYGEVVDIYHNNATGDGTARDPLAIEDIHVVNTAREPIKYYHGGENCTVDADCPFSPGGSRSGELLAANNASGLTQTCVPNPRAEAVRTCSNFDDDARTLAENIGPRDEWVPVEYFFCEDIRSLTRSLPGCSTWDNGDSFREIVRNLEEQYQRSYLFSNFRRYRRNFSIGGYFGRLFRYAEPMLSISGNLIYRYADDPEFRETVGPFGFTDEFLATTDVLNFFARMLSQPSIGSYTYSNGWNRYELSSFDVEPDAQVAVEFGQGRYLNSIYQTGLTGITRIERIGQIYDILLAMQLLTIRGVGGPFYGSDVFFDTNFYDIFPNEIQQIFTGMIASRPEDYMPRLQCDPGSTFPDCDNPRIVYMDFYRGNCFPDETGEVNPAECRPNPAEVTYRDLEVLNGGTRFFLQSLAASYALAFVPIYYDADFQNQMFICTEGQGDCFQPDGAAVEGVDYVRHHSQRFNKNFLAWQVEPSEGVAEQTSIAFAMVKEASDDAFIIEMLRVYRGDFEPGDVAPSITYLSAEQQAQLAAIGYELPTAEDQIQFEIDRLDGRVQSLERFFFYLVQLERFYGIQFPGFSNRNLGIDF